ncbi:MAG: pyridoxamine 5'-phosphate oxidase family protein [Rhodospirillaceae bacterium]
MEGSRAKTEEIEKLRDLIADLKVAMMTTVDHDGSLRSRPLQTLEMDANDALWFFTSVTSPKIAEVAGGDWQVNLSYAHPEKQDYVSLSGTATVVRDTAKVKALWTDWAKAWFPQGPDDPDLALLRVDVHKAEYWDGPGTSIGQLYGLTKAIATGEKDALGENAKLNL